MLAAALVWVCLAGMPALPQSLLIAGVVVDSSGSVVPGVAIQIEIDGVVVASSETSSHGSFAISGPFHVAVTIVAAAPGFATSRTPLEIGSDHLRIVLDPARLHETVAVTASRGAVELNTPTSATVIGASELATAPAGAIDDVLRGTPGFGLTRRTSSRAANPATQGVTMRGLPGNAGSRTLVLGDGLPLNDAFGGWVYWNRIPEAAIERIEVVRGAAGDLYGGDAVSGVIQVLAFTPSRSQLRTTFDGASPRTSRASMFGARKQGPWGGAVAGEWVDTAGVPIVAAAERGAVDVNATSDYRTGYATGEYEGAGWRARARFAAYQEHRGHGTPLVVNRTDWKQYSGELTAGVGRGTLVLQTAYSRQDYYNNFSSVAANRGTERVTSEQWVPSQSRSVSAQWRRAWPSTMVVVGGDVANATGDVREIRFAVNGTASGPFVAGGSEGAASAYARVVYAARGITYTAGARTDFWRSTPRETSAPEKRVAFFSPKLSVSWQARPALALRAAITRAYRTPTLDELHRSSQVGNTITQNNPLLDPEALTSLEAAALLSGSRAAARVTGYWSSLTDAITNITVSSTSSAIVRQKQNSDTVRATGLEVEGDFRLVSGLVVNASMAVTSSRYRHEIKLPALEGRRVPQIPRYQVAVGASYADARLGTVTAQVRGAGAQYEDDLNTLVLAPFRVVDVSATRPLGRGVHAYVAVENLLNAEIQTGRTPVTKIGWPRMARVGVRVVLP